MIFKKLHPNIEKKIFILKCTKNLFQLNFSTTYRAFSTSVHIWPGLFWFYLINIPKILVHCDVMLDAIGRCSHHIQNLISFQWHVFAKTIFYPLHWTAKIPFFFCLHFIKRLSILNSTIPKTLNKYIIWINIFDFVKVFYFIFKILLKSLYY